MPSYPKSDAQKQFNLGDAVVVRVPTMRERKGVVKGYCRDGKCVRVHLLRSDGTFYSGIGSFHTGFITKETEQ